MEPIGASAVILNIPEKAWAILVGVLAAIANEPSLSRQRAAFVALSGILSGVWVADATISACVYYWPQGVFTVKPVQMGINGVCAVCGVRVVSIIAHAMQEGETRVGAVYGWLVRRFLGDKSGKADEAEK